MPQVLSLARLIMLASSIAEPGGQWYPLTLQWNCVVELALSGPLHASTHHSSCMRLRRINCSSTCAMLSLAPRSKRAHTFSLAVGLWLEVSTEDKFASGVPSAHSAQRPRFPPGCVGFHEKPDNREPHCSVRVIASGPHEFS